MLLGIKREELMDEDVDESMPVFDQVSVALMEVKRKRQRQQKGL